jgi:hypothetical protein
MKYQNSTMFLLTTCWFGSWIMFYGCGVVSLIVNLTLLYKVWCCEEKEETWSSSWLLFPFSSTTVNLLRKSHFHFLFFLVVLCSWIDGYSG